MIVDSDNDLEGQIAEWRAYMHRHRELHHTDVEELEDHLRSRITDLTEAGLQADRDAGLAASPAAFQASGDVIGERSVPGWAELAEVFLFHKSYFPVLTDPDLESELKNYRASVARAQMSIADYRREERRLLDEDQERS